MKSWSTYSLLVWLFSIINILKFIHIVVYLQFGSFYCRVAFHCTDLPHFVTQSPAHGDMSFQFLAITDKTAVNIDEQVLVWTQSFFFVGKY